MPTAVKETGSGTNPAANTYATVAEVETYADNSLDFDNWNAATSDNKTRAVIKATRILDKWLFGMWRGWPSLTTQPLAWPRAGCVTRQGGTIANNEIHQMLVNAVAELANLCLGENLEEDQETGLSSLGLGSINLVFNPNDRAGVVKQAVLKELQSVLTYTGSAFAKAVR